MVPYTAIWKELLINVSKTSLSSAKEEDFEYFGKAAATIRKTLWLGYKGATEEQITDAEKRLGIQLPPDYRQLLALTNGWRGFNNYPLMFVDLLTIEEIKWFARDDRIATWKNSFSVDHKAKGQWYWDVPEDHFHSTLLIGESDGNECILLNPRVKTSYGDWEAWAYQSGEIYRVPSLWYLMLESAYNHFWSTTTQI